MVFTENRMSNSRRTRIAIFSLFMVGFIFPPSWVLCVEPSGEVHVEQARITCCASAAGSSGARFASTIDSDCEGCLDIAPSVDALRFARTKATVAGALIASSGVRNPLPTGGPARAVFYAPPHLPDPQLAHLSTTVILR
jgi:hypothetical protein